MTRWDVSSLLDLSPHPPFLSFVLFVGSLGTLDSRDRISGFREETMSDRGTLESVQ